MSAFLGTVGRRRRSPGVGHHGSIATIPVLMVVLVVGLVSAEPPSTVLHLSAADIAAAGATIDLVPRVVTGEPVLEILPSAATAGAAANLLAVSPDGAAAALADRIGEQSGVLTIASADGSQLRIPMPGLIAAGFAADGAWLAVVDGRGALWRVDADSGVALPLDDGPFLGTPIATTDGSLLLLSVPSVEAPYRSRLVRFVPAGGAQTTLSPDELVYAAFPLADGGIAVAAHEPGGTVVRRVTADPDVPSQLLADLGPGAVNVAVAGDARTIAFEVAGAVYLIDRIGSPPRRLGNGSAPCFAADGSALLVRRGGGSVALGLDGSTLAYFDGRARFVTSAGCGS